MHPSDATLLALIHGELAEGTRAETEEHVASCDICAAQLAELRDGDAIVAGLLATLDHPLPRRLPPVLTRAPRLSRIAIAASIALLVAGAAAAAVPGTPVHRWVQEHLTASAHREISRPATPVASSSTDQVASGVEVVAAGGLTVSFREPEAAGTLIVATGDGSNVSLRAFSGAVAYQVGAGRIGVDNQRGAGRYQLEVPQTLERLTVLVGSQVIFRSSGGRIAGAGRDTVSLSIDRAQP